MKSRKGSFRRIYDHYFANDSIYSVKAFATLAAIWFLAPYWWGILIGVIFFLGLKLGANCLHTDKN